MAKQDPIVKALINGYSVDGYWADHPDLEDWIDEIRNKDTRRGFWEWLAAKEGLFD